MADVCLVPFSATEIAEIVTACTCYKITAKCSFDKTFARWTQFCVLLDPEFVGHLVFCKKKPFCGLIAAAWLMRLSCTPKTETSSTTTHHIF
jgi:hypothetical protein